MTSEGTLIQQGRTAIDAVSQRVRSDPEFAERFKEEPVAVLLEAGAPAEGMGDILRETGFPADDVSGYLMSMPVRINPSLGGMPGGLGAPKTGGAGSISGMPGGLAADCSGTCNCSSSCLFTF